jgi:hypothetical protein
MPLKSNRKGPKVSQVFTLPSHGFPYPDAFPEGRITVYPYNSEVEQTIADEGIVPQERINKAVKCIAAFPEVFNTDDLLVGDQYYVFAASRSMSGDAQYKFKTQCSSCGKQEEHEFTLPNGLPIKEYPATFKEPLTFDLPDLKDTIGIRFLRVRDEKQIRLFCKTRKQVHNEQGDITITARLASHIASVNDGQPDNLDEAYEYVKGLAGADFIKLRTEIQKSQPGLMQLLRVQCPHSDCNTVYTTVFPINADFFRPES